MGLIVSEVTGQHVVLEAAHLVGRSEQCSLRIGNSYVSHEHASIRWDGDQWVVKDLGSLNRTFVNEWELKASESRAIACGARIAFGSPAELWRLDDDGAPTVMAVPEDGGNPVVAINGLLALPSADQPSATVYRGRDGTWMLDIDGSLQEIRDRAGVTIGGKQYRICLPHVCAHTTPVSGFVGCKVADLNVCFLVSADLEQIELLVAHGGVQHRMAARSHNEVLLLLARVRRQDASAGLPMANSGWIYQDELCRRLRQNPERLNVDVYRIRKQFAELGLLDPGQVVERRTRSRQLRFGIAQSSERPL